MKTQTSSRAWVVTFLTIIGLLLSISMFGHHGTGISYDQTRWVTVTGTVTEFAWKNPHSQLYLDVTDEKGNPVHYAIEMNSPGVMIRQGWTRRQFKAGDKVSLSVHPSLTGAAVGECIPCSGLLNGKELPKPVPEETQPATPGEKQ